MPPKSPGHPGHPAPTRVLLVRCPDATGVVAAVSGALADLGLNILDADQHADPDINRFFMRVGFTAPDKQRDPLEHALTPLAERLNLDYELRWSDAPPRVAILAGPQTHCVSDLLWRASDNLGGGELDCTITGVISNHTTAEPLARGFTVPFAHIPLETDTPADQHARNAQETAVLDELARQQPDLVILARYMRVLSPRAVAAYPGRIINIHHSFLPAFAGARPYHRAFERGVKLIGATAHYVTDDLDEGPIIAQQTRPVSHRDTVADLVRKGRDLERVVLAEAVRLHLEGRVMVEGRRSVVFD
ncbi:MAG: formyltetrahydrofolate deformylase [Planctomycetota bacterium]